MATNTPTLDDAQERLHIGYSVFLGVCVAVSTLWVPSFFGASVIPPLTPLGAMHVLVAFTLGTAMACHVYIYQEPSDFRKS